jgi:hypothetical protein
LGIQAPLFSKNQEPIPLLIFISNKKVIQEQPDPEQQECSFSFDTTGMTSVASNPNSATTTGKSSSSENLS